MLQVSSSGAGIGSDEESEGDQEESWGPVCEQCGRPGYHVHVPAVGPGECDSDG